MQAIQLILESEDYVGDKSDLLIELVNQNIFNVELEVILSRLYQNRVIAYLEENDLVEDGGDDTPTPSILNSVESLNPVLL
jgi:hypothetical protein